MDAPAIYPTVGSRMRKEQPCHLSLGLTLGVVAEQSSGAGQVFRLVTVALALASCCGEPPRLRVGCLLSVGLEGAGMLAFPVAALRGFAQ